jgi:hypothetical protein
MLSTVLNATDCTKRWTICPLIASTYVTDIHIFESITEIPVLQWKSIVPADCFFMSYDYLHNIETSETNRLEMKLRYATFVKGNKTVAAAVFQIVHINGSQNFRVREIVAPQGQTLSVTQHAKNWAAKRVNNLHFTMLLCGNAYITGEHGFVYNKTELSNTEAFDLLDNAIRQIMDTEAQANRPIHAVLVKDFEPQHLQSARRLACCSFNEVVAQPNMVLPHANRWANFDDYLSTLSAKYRTRAKSVFKKAKVLERRVLSVEEISEQQNEIYRLYRQVCEHSEVSIAYCTPQYFAEQKQKMPNEFQLIGYYLQDTLVGFISLFNTPTYLEAHFVGYEYELNKQYAIYNNILYDIVRTGIENKSPKINFGRTATEIKSTVGAEPIWQNSFMRHRTWWFNKILGRLVDTLRPDDWIQRHPFKEKEEV